MLIQVVRMSLQSQPTQPLISMIRVLDASGAPLDGTLPASWAASQGPSVNFKLGIEGTRVANPGASAIARPTAPTPPPVTPKVAVAAASDIMITEIMVDTDNGRLPQWIELTHSGTGEVSLDGWEMVIANAIDADVIGGGNAITVSLSGVTLDVSSNTGNTGKGQSVLVVAWAAARSSANIKCGAYPEHSDATESDASVSVVKLQRLQSHVGAATNGCHRSVWRHSW